MLSLPLVSVVIPSFQHVRFVGEAVESVLAQSVRDLEVIVVDDGSTDGTPERVARIRDPRIKLVRLPENRRDHARNRGLEMATGKYVAFQNSDDVWQPDKLAQQLAVLECQPTVGACFTAVGFVDDDGNAGGAQWAAGLFTDGKTPRTSTDWLRVFFWRNELCISSAVVRHDLLRQVGHFKRSLVQLSDLDMWVRMAARSEFFVVPEELTRMRIGGQRNLSAPSPERMLRSTFELAEILERYVASPIVDRLPHIFPESGFKAADPRVLNVALLAHAASRKESVAHRLFADRVLARLIDDPAAFKLLVDVFGTQVIHAFWNNRGQLISGKWQAQEVPDA